MADEEEGREFFRGPQLNLPPVGSPPGEYVDGTRVSEPESDEEDTGFDWAQEAVVVNAIESLIGVVGPPHTLADWWHDRADKDLEMLGPKVNEYGGSGGSYDLDLVGRILADTTGRHDASRAVREELGCFHYLTGKLGRMAAAYREGRLPSDDTIDDMVVYLNMIRRIRAVGGWPWSSEDPADA